MSADNFPGDYTNRYSSPFPALPNRSNARRNDPVDTAAERLRQVHINESHGRSQHKKSRGVSINHLINFSFPERPSVEEDISYRKPTATATTSYQPYQRERFINANFRFLLKASTEYAVHAIDPDAHFDWDNVQQVLVSSSKTPTCPICLSPPEAARVAKCGHIFCLPCILRFLDLAEAHPGSQSRYRECPICWDFIFEADLKSVRIIHSRAVDPNNVEFCLMQRSHASAMAFPISDYWPVPDKVLHTHLPLAAAPTPWDFTENALPFARFMLASPDYMLQERQRDVRELTASLEEAAIAGGDDETTQWIEKCIDQLNTIIDIEQQSSCPQIKQAMAEARKIGESTAAAAAAARQRSDDICTSDYYFYQAADGQHIYLHPLYIRILKHEFGNYHAFPRRLQVPITHTDDVTMTEEVRRKLRYLGHLPLACDITVVDLDLTDVVSPQTLSVFEHELQSRREKVQPTEDTGGNSPASPEEHANDDEAQQAEDVPPSSGATSIMDLGMEMPPEDDEEAMLEYVLRLSAAEHAAQPNGSPAASSNVHVEVTRSDSIPQESDHDEYDELYEDDEYWMDEGDAPLVLNERKYPQVAGSTSYRQATRGHRRLR
ncbi:uncharacterized protein BYT42DRAFT_573086 [Radiomyces spectabilis]|uniref:uncharacterized protein n=1 Tax=Radiomyces spectabilis TaxID=64574 RepID=UPI002220E77A|nr:uncharacterized protein BYT42DRAFT_573086 [Radiomyces spectabilis]KAI8376007.1 hypothetical protein BYT42DRAFT_573086 [Radiomyces spectabilis]